MSNLVDTRTVGEFDTIGVNTTENYTQNLRPNFFQSSALSSSSPSYLI